MSNLDYCLILENMCRKENHCTFMPYSNIEDKEKSYHLTLDVPGIKREDLNVEVVDEELVVIGKRTHARNGSFEKRYQIDSSILVDGITANLVDGVLTVELPKVAKKVRKIEIA